MLRLGLLMTMSIAFLTKISFACPKEKLYLTHEALFQAFLPHELKIPRSDEKTLLEKAKNDLWEKIKENSELKLLLMLFCDFYQLTNPILGQMYSGLILKDKEEVELSKKENIKPVINYLKSLKKYSCNHGVSSLNDEQILHLVDMLVHSESNYWRRLGFSIKIYYSSQLYAGPLGDYVSKIDQSIIKQPRILPKMPALKTHLYYDKEKNTIEGELDYIVVGSGAAASVIAYELINAGFKVLMIEKGSFPLVGSMETMSNFNFMESGGMRPDVGGNIYFFNGEGVGGGPMVNMNIYIPPTESFVLNRIKSWKKRGLIPDDLWTEDEIFSANDYIESILKPRSLTLDDVDSNNQYIAKGAMNLGYSYKLHKLTTYDPNENPYKITDKNSSLERFILPSLLHEENPLSILPNCEVTKVRIKKNKAFGVKCKTLKPWIHKGVLNDPYDFRIKKNTEVKIRAKKVILSAGNLGTSTILLKTPKVKNSNIGKGIIAHPAIPIMAEFPKLLKAFGAVSGVFVDEFITKDDGEKKLDFLIETSQGNASLGAILIPGNPDEINDGIENLSFSGGAAVVLFDSMNKNNHIELDLNKKPMIYYELSKKDKERAILGICHLMKILLSSGAKKVSFGNYEGDFEYITDFDQVEELKNKLKLTSNQVFIMSGHMMGGNKIGISKENSVVDSNHEVFGTKNLFVVDASVIPESPFSNPMPFIYSMAKIFVDKEIKNQN